jgi:phosphoglycolate phosphatase-like HAD superfamily hydrolase
VKLLALDFDGVIADSAPEAFWVALCTFAALRPGTRLAAGRGALLGAQAAPPLAALTRDPLYAPFVALMPLGNRAEDYGVALAALEQGLELPDQAAYDAFRAGQSEAFLRDYHERFYALREVRSAADPAGWRALIPPYAPFVGLLRRRAPDVALAIATAKDRRSVGALLESYGIADLFPERRILDKEAGVSKVAHLEQLQRAHGVGFAEITFLDDKVNHLDRVRPLGVRCGLARWGYNGPREALAARARGYLVCELADAEAQLFG